MLTVQLFSMILQDSKSDLVGIDNG